MATSAQAKQYIKDIAPIIQKYAKEYGYKYASPIIAQACIESAYGQSSLAYKYHNYFGMKCGSSWQGKSVNLSTREEYTAGTLTKIKANFRVYDSMDEGVKGYFVFISVQRYNDLKNATSPKDYLEKITADGYATSNTYVNTNLSCINKYDLTQYDTELNEEAGKTAEGRSMIFEIGSARIDEKGKATGGAGGDQKQKDAPDYAGEVSLQKFYIHKKGWLVFRPKNPEHAYGIAWAMYLACNNKYIGYNQSKRLEIIKQGIKTKKPCNCDCSSLVRQCVIEATGKDPGNFTTANEPTCLKDTGLFEKAFEYKPGDKLYTGDILVTKTKGHTAVVTAGYERETGGTCNISAVLPKIRRGDKSKAVKVWQAIVGAAVDGDCGAETYAKTTELQKKYDLTENGVVDADTWQAGFKSIGG